MHEELGEFDVIYADPPWSYSEVPYFKKSLAIQYKYPTLKLPDLLELNVESIAKKHSWLFLWAVWAQLPHALKVMDAWGFSYRTCAFVWAKKTAKNWKNAKTYGRCCTQGSTEVVLCGKRGSPKRYAKNVEQFLESARRGNSQKPDEIYERIDRITTPIDEADESGACPDHGIRKIELFARQQWGSWDALGNDESLDQKENPYCLYGDIRDIIGIKEK